MRPPPLLALLLLLLPLAGSFVVPQPAPLLRSSPSPPARVPLPFSSSPSSSSPPLSSEASPSAPAPAPAQAFPLLVVPSSFDLAAGTYAFFLLLLPAAYPLSLPFLLLSLLFAVQAKRLRFVFTAGGSFDLSPVSLSGALLPPSGNVVVGGANSWPTSSFVNYAFFPSPSFPVLVYFKETATPRERWGDGPGALDEVGGGQIHFFPAIADVEVMKEEFERRGCKKK
ncbi:hypothetical protein TeGR_g14574 [Tetraparma gracilis]|uniref:Uncharacterized protein n=1 Tax=Tetraparma gracilis TaxID=2962635 RepID=A0ABQ6M5S5_9STRA|nr:hypothetical protein TeGR_g14574 [Tetraparma gracilis]